MPKYVRKCQNIRGNIKIYAKKSTHRGLSGGPRDDRRLGRPSSVRHDRLDTALAVTVSPARRLTRHTRRPESPTALRAKRRAGSRSTARGIRYEPSRPLAAAGEAVRSEAKPRARPGPSCDAREAGAREAGERAPLRTPTRDPGFQQRAAEAGGGEGGGRCPAAHLPFPGDVPPSTSPCPPFSSLGSAMPF